MMFGKPSNEPKPETEFPSLAAEPEPAPVPVPKPVERIDTIIGEGTRILGTLHCKTLLRVDGVIEGDVISDSKVVVSEMPKSEEKPRSFPRANYMVIF